MVGLKYTGMFLFLGGVHSRGIGGQLMGGLVDWGVDRMLMGCLVHWGEWGMLLRCWICEVVGRTTIA